MIRSKLTLETAQVEFDEAVEYYNYESFGLGDEFLQELLSALDRIAQFPEAWHPLSKRTRRCLVKRFPYGVIYTKRGEEIIIIAVANLHQKPDYWKKRLSGIE